MAAHSSILAWRIPWAEKPGGLPSIGLQRVGHDWSDLAGRQEKKPLPKLYSSESTSSSLLRLDKGQKGCNGRESFSHIAPLWEHFWEMACSKIWRVYWIPETQDQWETTSCYKCQEIDIKWTRNVKEWEIKLKSGKIIWGFMLGQNLGYGEGSEAHALDPYLRGWVKSSLIKTSNIKCNIF